MRSAHDILIDTCRGCGFKTRGTWGMRSDCLLGGYGSTERTPCAVIDLARTAKHPTRYGFSVPIVLASGPTWEAVLDTLRAAGELPAVET